MTENHRDNKIKKAVGGIREHLYCSLGGNLSENSHFKDHEGMSE
jgi:hypothetical protein